MNEPKREHRLKGLEPDNLLAFLALLGLLRALEAAPRPAWRARAAWSVDDPPLRPLLGLAEHRTAAEVCEAAAEGAAILARDYVFPQSDENDKAPRSDLDYSRGTARALLQRAAESENRRYADLLSALMSDAAEKDDKIEATPLCLLFGQGHQHFLDRLAAVPRTEAPPPRGRGRSAMRLTASETLREALFAPWTRQDPTQAFRWDPAEDVRYALRADDPSGEKSTTQHGANRLAALGLSVLTVVPVQRGGRVRLQVLGGSFERNEFAFHWPIWKDPISLAGLRTLLCHPDLPKGPAALGHLGVVEVRRARRIGVGKFMNFTRAEPVVLSASSASNSSASALWTRSPFPALMTSGGEDSICGLLRWRSAPRPMLRPLHSLRTCPRLWLRCPRVTLPRRTRRLHPRTGLHPSRKHRPRPQVRQRPHLRSP